MTTAYLGLGSNLGNRRAFLRGGRDALAAHPEIALKTLSGIYETEAQGGPDDNPPFLNAVIEIETTLSPQALLVACMAIEDEFGRTRPAEWAPRTLDIDILFYDDHVIDAENLQVPHPRLQERLFVLSPLAEIAPELRHPTLQTNARELLKHLEQLDGPCPPREDW